MLHICHFCRNEILDLLTAASGTVEISCSHICPHCENDLHCCFNCKFYDENTDNECRKSEAERILIKKEANYCNFFVFNVFDLREHLMKKKKKRYSYNEESTKNSLRIKLLQGLLRLFKNAESSSKHS